MIGAALGSLVGALLAGPTRAYFAERAEKVRVVGMRGVAEASLANSFPASHPEQRAACRAIYLSNDPAAYAELSLALARLEITAAEWAAIQDPRSSPPERTISYGRLRSVARSPI